MKRLFCIVMVLALLCAHANAETNHLPSVYDFEPLFENAAAMTGSGHGITSQNLTSSQGAIRTTFSVALSDSVLMNICVLNATQETEEVVVLGAGGDTDESLGFLTAISEVLYATGGITDIKETGEVLGALGFFTHLQDGDENSITINGIEYGYLVSLSLGSMMFYARIPE